MSSFQTDVQAWRDLFSLAGAAAATIIGLLFVALSLRTDIRKAPDSSLVRTVVSHNFFMLLTVLLISLFFMVPDMDPNSLGVSVLLTAIFPAIFFTRDLLQLRSAHIDRPNLIWAFLVPIACLLITAVIGIAFILDDDAEIGLFTFVVAMFLVIPTKNSWELLLASQEAG
jgi:hypothetical protein